jgi:ABC-type transport system involved in cytochrome c biogenesis permease subunit
MTDNLDDRPALPTWLGGLAASSMIIAFYLIFVWVSTERTMGVIQRIFYFHVPAATVSFVAAFVGGIASILYLKTRDSRYDDLSLAANESILVFETINIVMGSLWAKRVWGIWWTWDARLTSSFLLLLIYIAYVVAQRTAREHLRRDLYLRNGRRPIDIHVQPLVPNTASRPGARRWREVRPCSGYAAYVFSCTRGYVHAVVVRDTN